MVLVVALSLGRAVVPLSVGCVPGGQAVFSCKILSFVVEQPVPGPCAATAGSGAKDPDASRVPEGSYMSALGGHCARHGPSEGPG